MNTRDRTIVSADDRKTLGLNGSGFQNGRVAMAHSNIATIGTIPTTPGYDQWIAAVKPPLLSAMRGEIAVDDALRQATMQGDAMLQQFGQK